MKTKVNALIALLLIIIVATFSSGCNYFKSDEDKIVDRINEFADSFNSGNVDAMVNCLDSKTKTTVDSALGIGNAIIGEIVGYNITVQNVLGIVMGLTNMKYGDSLRINTISDIDITGTSADAVVSFTFTDNFNSKKTYENRKIIIEFKKESDDWLISSIK